MLFKDKLVFLLNTFNSSNSRLARAISVDPSLVSKWVNGKRTPAMNSPYLNLIADYFLRSTTSDYQQNILNSLLEMHNADVDITNLYSRKRSLIEWLADITAICPSDIVDEKDNASHSYTKLVDILAGINELSANTIQEESINNLDINIRPGQIMNYELFGGRKGKREAVLNFLSTVLSSDEPLELLLSSEEDMKWLLEDEEFLHHWAILLKEILKQGHKIIIIHVVNRNPAQITAIMNQWLALHLTGAIESYYHPRYEEPHFKKTLFIARGKMSILSISSDETIAKDNYTYLFRDQLIPAQLGKTFLSYLAECRPLVKTYKSDEMRALHDEIMDLEKRPGYYLALINGLSSLTIPAKLFAKLIEQSTFSPDEKKDRMILHQQRIEFFLYNTQYYRYQEILCIESIDALITENACRYSASEMFLENAIKIEPIELLEHLSNIIRLLETNDNYEVFLLNQKATLMPDHMHLVLKEDFSAMVSSCDGDGNKPFALFTNEGNSLQALEDYFTEIYTRAPKNNRNKEWVIEKLKRRVTRLENILRSPIKHVLT